MPTHKSYSFTIAAIIVLATVVITLWSLGFLVELFSSERPSMLLTWGQISLTMFGFCLIGSIFEKSKKDNRSPIIQQMLYASIAFLISGLSMLLLYSLSFFFQNSEGLLFFLWQAI